jgi:5-methyltetrahydrofolate--homocysteine methyltransferase
MLQPYGALDKETASKNYSQQAAELTHAGVDLLLIETQFDIAEAAIAVEAAKLVSELPIICSFSFDRGIKTMMGVNPSKFAEAIAPMGVAALGANCGKSLEDNLNVLIELASVTDLPVWFKPNAGLPEVDGSGQAVYDVTPAQMAGNVKSWIEHGARIIGGCCGTSPEHLRAIKLALESVSTG